MPAPPIIGVAELTKPYGEIHAVRGISFQTNPNGIACFLGRNGAGKI